MKQSKTLTELTNSELVRKHESLSKRMGKLNEKICDLGLGHLRLSETRQKRHENPIFNSYIKLVDQCADVRNEAERRYGPDLIYVGQLKHIKQRGTK